VLLIDRQTMMSWMSADYGCAPGRLSDVYARKRMSSSAPTERSRRLKRLAKMVVEQVDVGVEREARRVVAEPA